VNIYRNYPVRLLWHFLVPMALVAAVALAQEAPKKITKAEAMSAVTIKVTPEYPPMARQLKMAGTVVLQVVVSELGEVTKVEIVKGNPVLTAAAAQAVKKWKFRPFVENGKAIVVEAPVELEFSL
jgi:protein TonB